MVNFGTADSDMGYVFARLTNTDNNRLTNSIRMNQHVGATNTNCITKLIKYAHLDQVKETLTTHNCH